MTPTAAALLGFAAWALFLLLVLALYRTGLTQTAGRKANSFSASGDDVDGFGKRVTRAHANCYEFLPIAGAVLLYAIATDQEAATNGLAYIFLAARIGQSVAHLMSTSSAFVLIRFLFFLPQVVIVGWWILKLSGLL